MVFHLSTENNFLGVKLVGFTDMKVWTVVFNCQRDVCKLVLNWKNASFYFMTMYVFSENMYIKSETMCDDCTANCSQITVT